MKAREGAWNLLIAYCVLGPLPGTLCKPMIFFHLHNIHQEVNIIIPGLHIS